jgi:hypothetical protein
MKNFRWMDKPWEMPQDFDYRAAIDTAQRLATNYAVVFVGENKRKDRMELIGSGTLVSIAGVKGILTADHVTRIGIYEKKRTEFSICYKTSSVRPFNTVTPDQVLPVVVGKYSEDHEENGPDLTFLTIIDEKLAETLGRIKSFFPLKDQIDLSKYPLKEMPWTISGSPADEHEDRNYVRYEATDDGRELLRFTDFHIPAYFSSLEQRDGFDYLKLRVNAGDEGPTTYEGVSGGGMWVIAVDSPDPKSAHPLLEGVCYYATTPEKGIATIIGHGPDSIYKRLREKILNG